MLVQPQSDALNAGVIQAGLKTQNLGQSLHIVTETPSTNTLGLTLAGSGEPHGTVILAEHQTAGKGRLGRTWVSPPHKNIYCSVICRDPRLQPHLSWIPLATGLALSKAIEEDQKITPSLKWPNDLLIGNKKLGGILCESMNREKSTCVIIIGFGINVNADLDDFPQELQESSTSLSLEKQESCNRNRLLIRIFNQLEKWYDQLALNYLDEVHAAYSAACSTLGMDVRCVLTETKAIHGRATAIGKEGSLHVTPLEQDSKKIIEIHSADVIHVRS
ncbi:biotin--[acetyl-CoA-carboxylase] ligase [Candidatus Nitronereus thalassa]|uniref:Biotin--[acetyl-CoA-carboxylase] ligase n=1 Tax=Candidatus Nitronereus thalassa TaxID=3020898 RepID=A0ABU3K3W3_9BACT|nr:biotin--[acetyl-CoA-carboxylase] ligase [Candidatus Nitronereus thalassa]MDT7041097.1 biotin--[acetyl-CoA-carboxylase] ligase [Candidatus Nitronereus thalassa]